MTTSDVIKDIDQFEKDGFDVVRFVYKELNDWVKKLLRELASIYARPVIPEFPEVATHQKISDPPLAQIPVGMMYTDDKPQVELGKIFYNPDSVRRLVQEDRYEKFVQASKGVPLVCFGETKLNKLCPSSEKARRAIGKSILSIRLV